MKYHQKIKILGLPKTMNSFRLRPWVYAADKKLWETLVAVCFSKHKPKATIRKCRIVYSRHSVRQPDYDNLVSSFKSIQDAMKKLGIILDDSPSVVIESKYLWFKAPRNNGFVEIEIEELD